MLSTSPPERMEQLITVFSQRLQPLALQRLSVAEILRDASAFAIIQEEIPPIDNFHIMKQQKPCFGRMLKFLHVHEPTGYEKDEEHKRTAMRYLALRTMLQQCSDIKVSTTQEACINKMLRWFEETEVSATASTPILPPRMSPKKPCFPPTPALDKYSSESSFLPGTTTASNASVATKLEKYKMPDLRASHIRRIAELRSRGADISDKTLPAEENNNRLFHKLQRFHDVQKKEEEKRMVEATFKLYHPETDAEREMNLLWIRRRQEEKVKRKKDEEVHQRVQKWAMDRSRDESENLRKRESTKLVAGLGQLLQEGVDQEKPFARQSSSYLHPDLAGRTAYTNQSTTVAPTNPGVAMRNAKEISPQDVFSTRKQTQTSKKQPSQIVIKSRKTSVSSGGGMHFRNQLPPNYVPPGQLAAVSVPKPKCEILLTTLNTRPSSSKESSDPLSRFERRASALSDDDSSASEKEEEPAMDDSAKRKRRSDDGRHQMKLQSYHVPYYYNDSSDHTTTAKASTSQQSHLRGTIPVQSLPADPELRCLQEASAMRRVFALPSEKKTEREASSSRKSTRSEPSKPRGGSRSAKGKRSPNSSRNGVVLPRTAPSYTPFESQLTASTSDLRNAQMEELEKIRRLFEENNLSFSSEALERGLLVPEDRPLLESINNLPFPGSRLLHNPLIRSKAAKPKKKPATSKKKKTKKAKKNSKSSRRTAK
ncbi:hypothetical protein PC129_g7127 [Phytophthora cactorum]|uniref:Uncharacterized protein n=1 Tax=Phytophthora cactorum TaxID=29920 RepID=A0A329SII6_9STRA|nr:hypothetical protein Pcac1_g9970 [Phytophthora cactorum]KAG2832306.1 hypothetical protein PC111_g6654 [Phytophthora cactorum]KAG2835435.1 hypothetical protein PC112_g5681 [Phytophthora cactorum]KAG2865251.1 hypothetical protein PC113_g3865 [Phytophthora cactorum]KAG2914916.1 hypothetical protein PC114_g7986 [Phytophthora cactorum]